MHRRELLPLMLMEANGGEEVNGRTRLQKMVFLFQKEKGISEVEEYSFQAYDYGPFSKELYFDLDSLIDRGLIDEVEEEYGEDKVLYKYKLTQKGQNLVERTIDDGDVENVLRAAEIIKDEYNGTDLSDVLDYVYSQYPEYTENSVLR